MDEWMHFNTTADGYSVVKNQQGYYVYAEKKNGELKATSMVAHDATKRKANEVTFLQNIKKYQAPEMSEEVTATKKRVEQQQRETLAKHRAASKVWSSSYSSTTSRSHARTTPRLPTT